MGAGEEGEKEGLGVWVLGSLQGRGGSRPEQWLGGFLKGGVPVPSTNQPTNPSTSQPIHPPTTHSRPQHPLPTQSLTLEGASPSLLQSVTGLALAAAKDRIPNVRFTAAQVRYIYIYINILYIYIKQTNTLRV